MKDFSASKIFEEKGHDDENYVKQQVKPLEKHVQNDNGDASKSKSKDIYKSIFMVEKKIGDTTDSFLNTVKTFFVKIKENIYTYFAKKAEETANRKSQKEKALENTEPVPKAPAEKLKEEIVKPKVQAEKQAEAEKLKEKQIEQEEALASVFAEENQIIEETVPKKKRILKTVIFAVVSVLIFALFFAFLLKQNSYVYLSHDDYGYATLSYVHWEEGMWGQNFSLEQLTHYLTEHYNRWGGRILGFAQEILLLQQGTDAMRFYNAFAVLSSFVLAVFLAQKGKKATVFPVTVLFACSLFGFLGENATIGGMYWYTASILYTVPVMYIFAGTLLLYTMLFGKNDKKFAVSKILMIPFCTVMFIFGAFSMEQVGIAAVMIVASMTVYSTFKDRNPLKLIYAVPPLLGSVWGYHILLVAIGNSSRKKMYAEYYSKSFLGQMIESGQNIANSLFNNTNLAFVILICVVTVICGMYLVKKRKNIFNLVLVSIDLVLGSLAVCVSYLSLKAGVFAIIMWIYLVFMALTVSIWLFSQNKIGDFVIWSIFFGGLVSQAACLISPVYHESCFIIFFFAFAVVSIRVFNQLVSQIRKEKLAPTLLVAMIPIVAISTVNSGEIYYGFKSNVRVQEYNEAYLEFVAEKYESGIETTELKLMKLKNERYTGSTMPYKRDLIKDWMKIYYKLPDSLQYDDFVYEEYDESRLSELEAELEQEKFNFENGITEDTELAIDAPLELIINKKLITY